MGNSKDDSKQRKAEREALREELLETQFELRSLETRLGPGLISVTTLPARPRSFTAFTNGSTNRYLNTRAFALPKGLSGVCQALALLAYPAADGRTGFLPRLLVPQPLMRLSRGQLSIPRFTAQMQQILRFERLLNDEGIILVKIWLHLTDDQQGKRQRIDPALLEQTVAMREWGDFSAADYEKVREGAR
ncbi:hypothetical protein ULF88_15780 [Halopseudomonas pachastrellae]|nr:hypothetical protein [Halopseudomonas pachastrellae]